LLNLKQQQEYPVIVI